MIHFRRAEALNPIIPVHYKELCNKLISFDELHSKLRSTGQKDVSDLDLKALENYHDQLLVLARSVLAPDREPQLVERANIAFAMGVLALHHYSKTVEGTLPMVDTVGSKTLQAFQIDWDPSAIDESRLREVLESALRLGDAWPVVDQALEHELSELEFRRRLIIEIDKLYPVANNEQVTLLFNDLFLDSPFELGDVGLVRTSTGLFFCLPYTGRRLNRPGFESRSVESKAAVAAFLKRLKLVRQEHFPAFTFFRGEQAAKSLLSRLALAMDSTPHRVARVLTTMVMIFRSQDIEMYLVHDIWGHHWQAHLFPFEDQFRTSARFRRLPDLDHEVSGEAGWRGSMGATLEQASRWLAKGETLADNYWDPYLSAVFLDRLMISGVVAVAEMLADVSEYKLHVIGGEAAEYLTSSSYFSKWPTKLDLTLMDARVVFGMALEGFERFARASNTGGQLLRRLLLAYPDLEPEFAIKAVEAFRKRVREMLEQEFDLKLRCEQRGDQLLINPFTRLCLNLMGMHTALNDLYRELSDEEREYPVPLKDFRDLLLLSIAGFYQGAPQVNFWHLDEFTGLCFRDCLDRFCEALAEPTT